MHEQRPGRWRGLGSPGDLRSAISARSGDLRRAQAISARSGDLRRAQAISARSGDPRRAQAISARSGDLRRIRAPVAVQFVVWPLLIFLGTLVCAGCSSNDEYRWEPHVVPGAKPAEKPKSDGKPEPELKLKRPPGTRI